MALLAPPEELQMDGDLEEAWPLFRQRFLLYMKAAGASQWPSDQKVALFLTVAGPAALQVYNTFQLDPTEEEDLEAVLAHFESYCMPSRNELYERFLFRTRLQEHHESLEDFIMDLQRKSRFCNFGAQREALVRDQIVLGCRSGKIRQRLLRQEGLTLEDALKICSLAQAKEEAQYAKERREQRAIEKQTRFQLDEVQQIKGPVCQQQVEDIGQWKVPVFQQKVEDIRPCKGPAFQQKVQPMQVMGNTKDNSQQPWDNSLRKESYKTYI